MSSSTPESISMSVATIERDPPMPARAERGPEDSARNRTTRVLVSGGEYVGVLAAVRGLAAAGYEPWTTVSGRRSYARLSRDVAGTVTTPDPSLDPDGFVAATAVAAHRLGAAVVLPGTEAALLALAARPGTFPETVAVGVCPEEAVRTATDKTQLEELARAAGLEVPPGRLMSADDLGAVELPVVVKPLRSELAASDGTLRHAIARRCDTLDDLERALDAFPGRRGIVQRYLNGFVYAVAGVFWEGEVIGAVHQAARRTWPVDCGVISYAQSVDRDHELERALATLLTKVGWRGLFQVQFLECDGRRYLIDLNPRIYGSLALAGVVGQNLTAMWADALLGRTMSRGSYAAGVRYRAEELDFRAIATLAARGHLRSLLGILPRRRTVHAVVSRRDPLPLLVSLRAVGALVHP
jgi:predicted ATP-grasp superfamily ATP-dependent carboligase